MRTYQGEFGPVIDGRLSLRDPGVVLDNLIIYAWIDQLAPDISLNGVWLLPSIPPPTSAGVINCEAVNATGLTATDVYIEPQVASPHWSGVQGRPSMLMDVEVNGCVDLVDFHDNTQPITVTRLRGGRHSFFDPDPYHSDGSHCDSVGLRNTKNITFNDCELNAYINPKIGSKIEHRTNAVMQITGTCENLTINGGYYDGDCTYMFNFAPGSYPNLGHLSDMRFGNGNAAVPGRRHVSIPASAVVTLENLTTDANALVSRF